MDISQGSKSGINFTLSAGGSISGKVTADGNPVKDVRVEAFDPDKSFFGGSRTNSNLKIMGIPIPKSYTDH